MQALLLAIYIGIFLNIPVFLRRFDEVKEGLHFSKWLTGSLEVMVVLLFTFFILRVFSLGGRWFFKITATLITLISVAASYYMTAFNVVIGYGIIISVFPRVIWVCFPKLSAGNLFCGLLPPALFLWRSSG